MNQEFQVITRIEQQRRNQKRFNIYVDDTYSFSIHEDILVSHQLFKGKEVNLQEIKDIMEKEEENKAWQKSLKYLSHKWRTEHEVRRFLVNHGYDEETIVTIINRLTRERLIDDQRYAKQYVDERIRLKPRGIKMIEHELRNKGVKNEDIDLGVQEINDGVERELAIILLNKKTSNQNLNDWKKLKQKLGMFLQRKGFSMDSIHHALNDYYHKNYIDKSDS